MSWKRSVRSRAGTIMVASTGVLLAMSLSAAGLGFLDEGAEADARAQEAAVALEEDVAAAEDRLAQEHAELLAQLPGVDAERASRDEVEGRALLLSITGTSRTSRTVHEAQVHLDGQYDFLDTGSRVLTEFVPEWMAATGSARGAGTTYAIGELDVSVTAVQGLRYTYTGIARMDPVAVDGGPQSAKPEYVIFTYTTEQDGTVLSLEAYQASTSTRDELLADGEEQTAPQPTPSDEPEPSDGSGG